MNTKIKLAAAGALLLAACDVKDPIYHTSHPDSGTITLTTDWSGIDQGVQIPASYTVRVGEYSAPLSGTTHTLDNYFAPGSYRAYVYNTPEHILINDATASVASVTTPAGQSGPFVHSAPGWLFTSALDAAIEKDTDHTFTALMQQQVRELTLVIEPTGGSVERIESIEGRLSGAAGSFDLDNGTHGTPSNVALTFSRITTGADAGKWSSTVRLLGTAGAEQTLHAEIAFTDNTPQSVTLDSDLTSALAAFNADKREPLALGGRMVETPTGIGFDATIEQWEAVEPVEGEAMLPEPKPVKIGDYFYSDGSYSTELDPKKTVIGIVFQTDPERIGEAEKEFLKARRVTRPHGLVLAVNNAGWDLGWSTSYNSDEKLPNCDTKEANNNDISGYGNCGQIRKIYGDFDDFPAFKAADAYNTTCPAPENTTGWYLPASGQWYDMLRNLGGLADWEAAESFRGDHQWEGQGDMYTALNRWLSELADADIFNKYSSDFWSSSEYNYENGMHWGMNSDGHVACTWFRKTSEFNVRAVLAF